MEAKFNENYGHENKNQMDQMVKYQVTVKSTVFNKFFQVLKVNGWGYIKVNNQDFIEMNYFIEKCPFMTITLETAAR